VRAFATDEPVLDERDPEAVIGDPPCRLLAGRPATDHRDIEASASQLAYLR
jgi:hypothetical protein